MTVPDFMSKAFSFQDLQSGGHYVHDQAKIPLGQVGLKDIPKIFMIFHETKFSYVSGNRTPKKLLIFQKLMFQEMEFF